LNYKLNDVSLLSKMTFMTILIDATYFLLFRKNCRAQMRRRSPRKKYLNMAHFWAFNNLSNLWRPTAMTCSNLHKSISTLVVPKYRFLLQYISPSPPFIIKNNSKIITLTVQVITFIIEVIQTDRPLHRVHHNFLKSERLTWKTTEHNNTFHRYQFIIDFVRICLLI
jgi:hypothetical protein